MTYMTPYIYPPTVTTIIATAYAYTRNIRDKNIGIYISLRRNLVPQPLYHPGILLPRHPWSFGVSCFLLDVLIMRLIFLDLFSVAML